MEMTLKNNSFIELSLDEVEVVNGGNKYTAAAGVFVGCIIVANAPLIGAMALGYGAWAAVGAACSAASAGCAIIDESLKWR